MAYHIDFYTNYDSFNSETPQEIDWNRKSNTRAAGGFKSTVGDLSKWAPLYMGAKMFDNEEVRTAVKDHTKGFEMSPGSPYTYHLAICRDSTGLLGHNGDDSNFLATLLFNPKTGDVEVELRILEKVTQYIEDEFIKEHRLISREFINDKLFAAAKAKGSPQVGGEQWTAVADQVLSENPEVASKLQDNAASMLEKWEQLHGQLLTYTPQELVDHASKMIEAGRLRKAVEGRLWNQGSFVGVDTRARETLIQKEFTALSTMSEEARTRAIEGDAKGRAYSKKSFKSHSSAEKPIRDFLAAKKKGGITDNHFYEALYNQLESTIDAALRGSSPEKPALILLGEAHFSEHSLAAEMFALHIAKQKRIMHCITETNDPGLNFSTFDGYPDDPTRIPRELLHLPLIAFKFAHEERIELQHGCDSGYFSEEYRADGGRVGPPPDKEKFKDINAWKKAFHAWEEKYQPIVDRRNETMNTNVDNLMDRLKKPHIMIVGCSHLAHLQPYLAQKGHCTVTAIDAYFGEQRNWVYPKDMPVTRLQTRVETLDALDLATYTIPPKAQSFVIPTESKTFEEAMGATLRGFAAEPPDSKYPPN